MDYAYELLYLIKIPTYAINIICFIDLV